MKRQPLICLVIIMAGGVLFLVAFGVAAGYESVGGLAYTDKVNGAVVVEVLAAVTWTGVVKAFSWSTAPWFLCGFLITLLSVIASAHIPASRTRLGAFAAQGAVVWPGWFGLWALPFDTYTWLLGRQDGEWLGEGWATLEASGLWLAATSVLFFLELRAIKRASHLGLPPNQSLHRTSGLEATCR